MSVVLGHLGTLGVPLLDRPILSTIFAFFSNSTNSVQIFFILSGFLMAHLYPKIPDALEFIQKRYFRIFPLVGVVVIYAWTIDQLKILQWPIQLVILALVALSTFVIWHSLRKLFPSGQIFFLLFIGLQVFVLSFFGLLGSRPNWAVHIPNFQSMLQLLANLTLTTPLFDQTSLMREQFWSLTPEIVFYILFPVFALPLIRLGKRWGIIGTIVVITCLTKIVFDLDDAMLPLGKLGVIQVSRFTGFMVGAFIGTIFTTHDLAKEAWAANLKLPIIKAIVLLAFVLMQTNYLGVINLHEVLGSKITYLISDWIIAATLICVLQPKSFLNWLFSNRFLVFLGSISYSIYLIHIDVIGWTRSSLGPTNSFTFAAAALLTIIVALFLNRVVESLYFLSHKSSSTKLSVLTNQKNKRTPWYQAFLVALLLSTMVGAVYLARFSNSFIHDLFEVKQGSVTPPEIALKTAPVTFSFVATAPNLSIISFNTRYIGDSGRTQQLNLKPAQLLFELYNESKHKLLASSKSTAYLTDIQPYFQFGFSPLTDSKGQRYTVKLRQIGGRQDDQVAIKTAPGSVTAMYILSGTFKQNLFVILMDRLKLVVQTPQASFAICFFFVVALLQLSKMDLRRLRNRLTAYTFLVFHRVN